MTCAFTSLARAVAGVALAAAAFAAQAQATPAGLWKQIDDETKTEKSQIRIVESGGVYTGRIEKILDPTKADALCTPCGGALKDKPVLGMQIIQGLKADPSAPGVFDGGEILDPNNGKTYRLKATPAADGRSMVLRGYLGISLLGRSQTWTRIE